MAPITEAPPNERRTITLRSEDGKTLEIDMDAARQSGCIRNAIEGGDPNQPIPLGQVKYNVLEKAVEYMKNYVSRSVKEIPKPLPQQPLNELIDEWDVKFLTSLEQDMVFELILAANYLDIPGLLDLCCAKVASEIRGKTVEEIRKTFGIVNDFSPEEEAQIKEENRWCDPE